MSQETFHSLFFKNHVLKAPGYYIVLLNTIYRNTHRNTDLKKLIYKEILIFYISVASSDSNSILLHLICMIHSSPTITHLLCTIG